MCLPKDSFRARILYRKALGWLYFAHRAPTCKQRRMASITVLRQHFALENMAIRQPIRVSP
jgi:hypothetical protein